MRFTDRSGLRLTTGSADAAEAYNDGIEHLLGYQSAAEGCLVRAVEADDDFALPKAVQAYRLWMTGQRKPALKLISQAVRLAARATRREEQFAAAVQARLSSDPTAIARFRDYIAAFPSDAFALHQTVLAIEFGATEVDRAPAIHDLLRGVASFYHGDWWFPAIMAMSHEEMGDLAGAYPLALLALARAPTSAVGAHALSHILQSDGDYRAGLSFLGPWLNTYEQDGLVRPHLAWHLALFELADGNLRRVGKLFQEEIAPRCDGSFTALEDSASLLWRQLLLVGSVDIERWSSVCQLAAASAVRPGFAFRDAHAAMAFAGAGREDDLAALIASQLELGDKGNAIAAGVVAPLADGLGAFARGDYERALALLGAVRPMLPLLGGTRTQREVFEQTWAAALARAG